MARSRLEQADQVNEWVGRVNSFVILVIICITLFEVTMRYLFNKPTIWVHETSGFLQMVYILMGGGYTLLHRGHVRVDVIYARFSPKAQAIVDLTLTTVLFFFFTGVLLYFGGQVALRSFAIKEMSSSGIWEGQIWPFKQFIPIGTILIMFQFVLLMIRDFRVAFGAKSRVEKGAKEIVGF